MEIRKRWSSAYALYERSWTMRVTESEVSCGHPGTDGQKNGTTAIGCNSPLARVHLGNVEPYTR